MIFDTHTHLDMLKNLDKIITNARKTKVKTIITNSVNIFSLKKSLKIQKKYPEIVKLAAGLYPEETLSVTDFNELERFINKNKNSIIAIGEIGLDKTEKLDFEIQKKFFIKQLNLARKYSLPTIIHTRKAEKEVLEILKNYLDLKIVLHCLIPNSFRILIDCFIEIILFVEINFFVFGFALLVCSNTFVIFFCVS